MTDFKVSVRGIDDISIVELKGYLDAHTATELENTFKELINTKKFKIVVNFTQLSYISSAGLGVFMAFVETMRDNKGDIMFSNMTESVYNIFDLLGFPMLYKFFKDEQEAINIYKQQD